MAVFEVSSEVVTCWHSSDQLLRRHYDFVLPGGSRLTPRGAVRYASAHELTNITVTQANDPVYNYYQYFRVEGQVVGDLNLAWNSPDSRWLANAYVRNISDNRYKTVVNV